MVEAAGKRATAMQAGWLAMFAEALRAGGAEGITPGAFARAGQADGPPRRAAFRYYVRPRTGSRGRPRARPLRGLVRAVPALRLGRARAPRHLQRRRGAPAVCGRHGLRRALPAADPPDRPQLPQGPQQLDRRRAGRPGQPLGHRSGGGRAQGDSSRSWARSTTSGTWWSAAAQYGIELALDIAFQCAPDHPYVNEHPEWFRRRPDGTIQYAENPPKKYQDIYPFDFETEHWRELWEELKSVVQFWVDQGVRIFRVDNPHTKPFPFWEWLIAEIKRDCPEAIFLAEAFTRPKVMYRLAKLGFTQSYNYFPWRNTKWELTQYLTELTQTAGAASSSARTSGRTRPISCPSICSLAGARPTWPAYPCRHPGSQLRHLRAGLRAVREPSARSGQRGIPGLGEIRDQDLGH